MGNALCLCTLETDVLVAVMVNKASDDINLPSTATKTTADSASVTCHARIVAPTGVGAVL